MEISIGEGRLREFTLEDVPALAKHANNRNVWRNLNDIFPHPYSEADAREWIESQVDRDPALNLAVANDREAFGSIGLRLGQDVKRRSAEIGYWIGEAYWGRGIATNAVRAMGEYAFETFDLARLYAEVFEWNPASCRVLEKTGFTLEARQRKAVTKDGNTIDAFLYVLVR